MTVDRRRGVDEMAEYDALKVAKAIAKELEGNWKTAPGNDTNDAFIVSEADDGCRLEIVVDRYASQPKVDIFAIYPEELRRYSRPSITTAAKRDRSADGIARQIEKRVLPAYLEALGKAREERAARLAERDEQEVLARKISEAFGKEWDGWDDRYEPKPDNWRPVAFFWGDSPRGVDHFSATPGDKGEIKFEFNVPNGRALDVARFLAGLSEVEKEGDG
jgi:hypothetical protein